MTLSLLSAADTVRGASAGEPAALCRVYGHDERCGWRDRRLGLDAPVVSYADLVGPPPEGGYPDHSTPAWAEAVSQCARCGRVFR